MTVNEYIEKLQRISPDKRELDIRIQCPNGLEVEPKIKMKFKNYGNPLLGDELECMMVTWQE